MFGGAVEYDLEKRDSVTQEAKLQSFKQMTETSTYVQKLGLSSRAQRLLNERQSSVALLGEQSDVVFVSTSKKPRIQLPNLSMAPDVDPSTPFSGQDSTRHSAD